MRTTVLIVATLAACGSVSAAKLPQAEARNTAYRFLGALTSGDLEAALKEVAPDATSRGKENLVEKLRRELGQDEALKIVGTQTRQIVFYRPGDEDEAGVAYRRQTRDERMVDRLNEVKLSAGGLFCLVVLDEEESTEDSVAVVAIDSVNGVFRIVRSDDN
jgi:hypothetical protein